MKEEYDFANAKRAYEVPHLAKLQAEHASSKPPPVTIDNDVLETFRAFGNGLASPPQ